MITSLCFFTYRITCLESMSWKSCKKIISGLSCSKIGIKLIYRLNFDLSFVLNLLVGWWSVCMLSHVKSGAIYHNYSISPNISSSFFDFSSLSLSFRRFMPQFCCIAPWVMASLPQLCRPARRVYWTSFPSFPEPLRLCRPSLPARIVRHEAT